MNKIPKLIIRLPRLSHLASLDAFLLKRQKSGSQINETEAFSHKIPRLDQAVLEPKLHLPSLTSRNKQDEDEAYTQTIHMPDTGSAGSGTHTAPPGPGHPEI